MWPFKEKPIIQQIKEYNKDHDKLMEFAQCIKKDRIEEITLEDIKNYRATIIDTKNSQWERNTYILALRKFIRAHQHVGLKIKAHQIQQDIKIDFVGGNAKVHNMEQKQVRLRGKQPNMEMIKKAQFMRKEGNLTVREIAATLKKDIKTVHAWLQYPKGYINNSLLAEKFSTTK